MRLRVSSQDPAKSSEHQPIACGNLLISIQDLAIYHPKSFKAFYFSGSWETLDFLENIWYLNRSANTDRNWSILETAVLMSVGVIVDDRINKPMVRCVCWFDEFVYVGRMYQIYKKNRSINTEIDIISETCKKLQLWDSNTHNAKWIPILFWIYYLYPICWGWIR